MKKRYLSIIFGLAVVPLLAACGGGGGGGGSSASGGGVPTSKVTIVIGDNGQTAKVTANKSVFFAKAKIWLKKLMPDSAIASIPANVSTVKITITASDITTPIGNTYSVTPGGADLTATFDVPNGNNRTVTIEEWDNASHLVYRGTTSVNLNGGTANVAVNVKDKNTSIQDWLNNVLAPVLNKAYTNSLTSADLDPFFSQNFGFDDGWNRTQSINDILKDPPMAIKRITSVDNVAATPVSKGAYHVDAQAHFEDGSVGWWDNGITVAYENGAFVMTGNGFQAEVSVKAEAHVWDNMISGGFFSMPWYLSYNSGTPFTGLSIEIKDKNYVYNSSNPSATPAFQSAVVTGPGLPAGGVTMSWFSGTNHLSLDSSPVNFRVQIPTAQDELYAKITDADILNIPDNAVYTFKVYKDAAKTQLLETRSMTLKKRPFTSAEVAGAGFFPKLLTINGHAPDTSSSGTDNLLAAARIGLTPPLTFTFSKPSTSVYTPVWLEAELNFWGGSYNSYNKNVFMLLSQTSGSITSTVPSGWSANKGHLTITAQDIFDRRITYHWTFQ